MMLFLIVWSFFGVLQWAKFMNETRHIHIFDFLFALPFALIFGPIITLRNLLK